jgi:hypothetical protein
MPLERATYVVVVTTASCRNTLYGNTQFVDRSLSAPAAPQLQDAPDVGNDNYLSLADVEAKPSNCCRRMSSRSLSGDSVSGGKTEDLKLKAVGFARKVVAKR